MIATRWSFSPLNVTLKLPVKLGLSASMNRLIAADGPGHLAGRMPGPLLEPAFEPVAVAGDLARRLKLIIRAGAGDHLVDHVRGRHGVGDAAGNELRRSADGRHGAFAAPRPIEVAHEVEALRGADGGGGGCGQGRESGGGGEDEADRFEVFIPDLGEWVNGAIRFFGANGKLMWRVQISRAWAGSTRVARDLGEMET